MASNLNYCSICSSYSRAVIVVSGYLQFLSFLEIEMFPVSNK